MKHNFTSTLSIFILTNLLCPDAITQFPKIQQLWQTKALVRTIEFSSDHDQIVTGGALDICYPYQCGQIKLWNIQNGALQNTITNQGMGLTNDIDISSNDNTIISGNGAVYCYPEGGCSPDKPGQFKFSYSGNLQKSLSDPGGNVYAIRYSPDQSVIAAGTGYNNTGEIRIYSKSFLLLRVLPGHKYETDGLAFTPDSKYLVSGGDDGLVKVWNYKTGTLVRTLSHGTYLNGGTYVDVDVSPDGNYIASAGQGYNMTVKIWKVADGQLIQTLKIDGSDGYTTVRFSPDGKYVVAGVTQYGLNGLGWYGRILIWNHVNGTLIREITDKEGSPLSGGVRTIAFSSLFNNNYYFAYAVSDNLKVYQIRNSSSITGVENKSNVELASAKFNSRAVPNPFHESTTIQYSLPSATFVSIVLYNMDGALISTLLSTQKEAGAHTLTFNAGSLPTGTYIYRILSRDHTEVKKIIITNP